MIEQFYSKPNKIKYLRAGPLGTHIDAFVQQLLGQGYSHSSIKGKIRAVNLLSQWLSHQGTDIRKLDESHVHEFLEHHRGSSSVNIAPIVFDQMLRFLREIRMVPHAVPKHVDTRHPIEAAFEDYLATERGIQAASIRYQLFIARRFLTERFGTGAIDCSRLCAADVTRFTLRHAPAYKLRSFRTMLSGLKNFLRFLHMRGETPTDLTGCVFRVADWRRADLPNYLEPHQVEQLLQSIDQSTPSGPRNYAILLLLARLGVRAGEVLRLELEDIDWESGTLTVHGKSSQHNRLPIPPDVGEAIVKYLRDRPSKCSSRRVFLPAIAPYRELLSSTAITSIVKKYLERAGLHPARMGAHVLRHSLATKMIRGGNTLDEIGYVLGHEFHSSTEVYAKVATTSLRALAQPWPGAKS